MKKTFLLIMVVLIVFNISACNRSVIKRDDSISLDESISKLESYISETYSLEDFDLIRIYLMPLDGYSLKIYYSLYIEGYYGDNEKWGKSFDIKTKDDCDLLQTISQNKRIYNEELLENIYGADVIITDTPGWVIEGIYKTISDS